MCLSDGFFGFVLFVLQYKAIFSLFFISSYSILWMDELLFTIRKWGCWWNWIHLLITM